jgi:uncharacterized membrane protein YgcG
MVTPGCFRGPLFVRQHLIWLKDFMCIGLPGLLVTCLAQPRFGPGEVVVVDEDVDPPAAVRACRRRFARRTDVDAPLRCRRSVRCRDRGRCRRSAGRRPTSSFAPPARPRSWGRKKRPEAPDLLAPRRRVPPAPDLLAPAAVEAAASTLGSAKLEVASGEESSRLPSSPLRRRSAAAVGSTATAPRPTAAPRHEVRGVRGGGDGEGGGSGGQSEREGGGPAGAGHGSRRVVGGGGVEGGMGGARRGWREATTWRGEEWEEAGAVGGWGGIFLARVRRG